MTGSNVVRPDGRRIWRVGNGVELGRRLLDLRPSLHRGVLQLVLPLLPCTWTGCLRDHRAVGGSPLPDGPGHGAADIGVHLVVDRVGTGWRARRAVPEQHGTHAERGVGPE